MNARYYDSYIYHFQSRDPYHGAATMPASQNGYSYVHGNPVNYTDPTGNWVCEGLNCSNWEPEPSLFDSVIYRPWIDLEQTTAIAFYGNTNFAHSLGTVTWANNHPGKNPPNYGYSQGFHAGYDQFAVEGTSIYSGMYGRVVRIDTDHGYWPGYIDIQVGEDLVMRIAHAESDGIQVKLNSVVLPDTVLCSVNETIGHVHVEFISGYFTKRYNEQELLPPENFMPQELIDSLLIEVFKIEKVNYDGTSFYDRDDDLWATRTDQPTLRMYNENLNVGQGNYKIPESWK